MPQTQMPLWINWQSSRNEDNHLAPVGRAQKLKGALRPPYRATKVLLPTSVMRTKTLPSLDCC